MKHDDGHIETFLLDFDDPLKYFRWTIDRAVTFIWLPLCPDDEPIIAGLLRVKRNRAHQVDYLDGSARRGVPFDIDAKAFNMSDASFRNHRNGWIVNASQVSSAVYDRLIQVMRSI